VGRIPTSIIWQSFLMMFGLIGVVVNTIVLGTAGRLPAAALVLSFPAAVVGGLLCTAAIARTVVKVVKPGREAPGKRHLIGCSGTVVSGQVDEEFGEIRVRAPHGEQVNVYCAVRAGARPIAHHSEVVVVEYDRDRDRLIVAPLGLEEVEQAARRLPAGQRGSQ
jgi:membrane protein implicated in regulation of membrane protease activity